jgi:hypothetical protein
MNITTTPNLPDPLSDAAGEAWFQQQAPAVHGNIFSGHRITPSHRDAWNECARRAREIIGQLRQERYDWQTLATDAIRLLYTGTASQEQINELEGRYADLFCGEGK